VTPVLESAPMSSTRHDLHRLATHVLARRRHAVSGRFGLRSSPGGIATPAFGPEPEALRIAGTTLVREVGGNATRHRINGVSLVTLAGFAGADLATEFSAGTDTPPLGDVDDPINLDPDELAVIVAWGDLGWKVLDAVTADTKVATTLQLWPEHFDVGTVIGASDDEKVNLGFSPGDDFLPEPYAYIGPWTSDRPGDPSYWNAPFGATLARSALGVGDMFGACAAFVDRGLCLLAHGR
jgi:hypothetical protein